MVKKEAIKAEFFDQKRHRATLLIPLVGRESNKTLCVIGQNPSAADETDADKTIRYLEEFVYLKCPEYGSLLVLNLYSRVDTQKTATSGLLEKNCEHLLHCALERHDDFLLVFGNLKNEGAYRFRERAKVVLNAIKGKRTLKLDVGTLYPPHPGNPKIFYRNFDVKIKLFDPMDWVQNFV